MARTSSDLMRIGINALHVRAQRGGVGHYIGGLVEGLLALPEFRAAGHEIVLFASPEAAPHFAFDDPRYLLVAWGAREAGVGRRRLREWARLHREIARRGIDLWHGPSNFLPPIRPPNKPRGNPSGCRFVLTLHDVSYWLYPRRVGAVKRAYWRAWTRRSLDVADAIITASRDARHTISRTLRVDPGRFTVIPHAAHPRFRPDAPLHARVERRLAGGAAEDGAAPWRDLTLPEPGTYLLSVCTLEPGKNLDGLVRAFAALKAARADDPRVRDLRLVLAGGLGWLNEALFAEVRRAGLERDVLLPGYIPDAALPALYNGAAAFAFFSLNEGFGLPPLEALQCGVPVACADASSLPEVVGDAARLANPHDVDAMARALEAVVCDDAVRARLRAAGPARAARFSWEATARATLGVYERTLTDADAAAAAHSAHVSR